jgi:hypothetical protein
MKGPTRADDGHVLTHVYPSGRLDMTVCDECRVVIMRYVDALTGGVYESTYNGPSVRRLHKALATRADLLITFIGRMPMATWSYDHVSFMFKGEHDGQPYEFHMVAMKERADIPSLGRELATLRARYLKLEAKMAADARTKDGQCRAISASVGGCALLCACVIGLVGVYM